MMDSSRPMLALRGLSHRYGAALAVEDVSLHVDPGEVVCLLGPSGCGKTTLLRIAAGLESCQAGVVELDGRVVADARFSEAPEHRHVGMLFQDFALFPHLSVQANVEFGLRGFGRAERAALANDLLASVGLAGFGGRYPHTLSGGQQQRVALARAIAPAPRLMLMDEPFSGLDASLRRQIREDTLRLLKARGVAVLLVTHDPDEALRMADRIAVMRAGRLEQIGSPHEVYQRPLNAFVGEALGEINEFAAVIADGCAETPLGPIAAEGMAEGARARVLVRPESIVLARDECAGAASLRVVGSRLVGAITQVDLCSSREPADVVRVAHLDGLAPTPGERVWARLRAPNLAVIVSD